MSYTYYPNEIDYSGKMGLIQGVDDFISFGGEMDVKIDSDGYEIYRKQLLKKWEEICKSKISEAYDEYMKFKDRISD